MHPSMQAAALSAAASLRVTGGMRVSPALLARPSLPSVQVPILAPGALNTLVGAPAVLESAPAIAPDAREVSAVDTVKSIRHALAEQAPVAHPSSLQRAYDGSGISDSAVGTVDASMPRASLGQAAKTSELSGRALLAETGRNARQGHQPRDYDSAREYMYSVADNVDVKGTRGVIDAYSGVFVPGRSSDGNDYRERGDQNRDGYVDSEGINAEHVWPQSFFGKRSPMRSDLHNLMPTFMHPNGLRGHLPFGNVHGGAEYANNGGAKLGGGIFEPPAAVKGKVARALLYFYTRYQGQPIFEGDYGSSFWNNKLETLLQWNRAFPPDANERRRNGLVERFQGNRNPYIDDPALADRIGVEGFRHSGDGSSVGSRPSGGRPRRRHHGRGWNHRRH